MRNRMIGSHDMLPGAAWCRLAQEKRDPIRSRGARGRGWGRVAGRECERVACTWDLNGPFGADTYQYAASAHLPLQALLSIAALVHLSSGKKFRRRRVLWFSISRTPFSRTIFAIYLLHRRLRNPDFADILYLLRPPPQLHNPPPRPHPKTLPLVYGECWECTVPRRDLHQF